MKTILQSIRMLLVITVLTGLVYPLLVTGLARGLFPRQAAGSLLFGADAAQPVGSALLAQRFEAQNYFWPRPSWADYATVASGASNKGPTSVELVKAIDERREKFGRDAPIDLLTASGSGLDPHVSPDAALVQVARVAAARGLSEAAVNALVEKFIELPQLSLLGEPRVNVLELNRALDGLR